MQSDNRQCQPSCQWIIPCGCRVQLFDGRVILQFRTSLRTTSTPACVGTSDDVIDHRRRRSHPGADLDVNFRRQQQACVVTDSRCRCGHLHRYSLSRAAAAAAAAGPDARGVFRDAIFVSNHSPSKSVFYRQTGLGRPNQPSNNGFVLDSQQLTSREPLNYPASGRRWLDWIFAVWQDHPFIHQAVVKVRGPGGSAPLLRFEAHAIVYEPSDWIDKVLFYAQITPN